MPSGHATRAARSRAWLSGAFVVLVLATAWWVLAAWKAAPGRVLTMATGPEGGAYRALAERYRSILARQGVELRLRPTAGAVESLALLRDPASGVGVAFAPGGLASPEDASALVSLGTVFYEPLWIFHRGLDATRGLSAFSGRRVSIGPSGSATRALALRILGRGGTFEPPAELLALEPEAGAERLAEAKLDAVAFLGAWESPVVRRLLATPGVELASIPRADAHVALSPYLHKLVLPAGVFDLGRSIPPADAVLVATKAGLVVRRDLHPALQYLLLEAAAEVHSPPGLFRQAGQFPAAEAIDLALSEDARQYYKSGRPFLHRYLPFWLAALVERLLLVLVPLVGFVYPLARSLPALYAWSRRRRIFRLYGELKLIEIEAAAAAPEQLAVLRARLDDLEREASGLRVPSFLAWLLYTLRNHIRLVRERLPGRE